MSEVIVSLQRRLQAAEAELAQLRREQVIARELKRRIQYLESELTSYHRHLLDLLKPAGQPRHALPAGGSVSSVPETAAPPVVADESSARPQLLILISDVPTPDMDSGSFRIVQILKLLIDLGFDITLGADQAEPQPQHVQYLEALNIRVIYGTSAMMEHLRTNGRAYRIVVLSRPETAFQHVFAVRAYATRARVVYDTVDLHWIRFQRGAELYGDSELAARARQYKRIETLNSAASDVVLTVTDEEKRTLLQLDGSWTVEVLPNIHPSSPTGGPWEMRRDLMFIGGFWHQPNEDAVCYFVEDVMPLIRKSLPDVVFNIIGSHMSDRVKALASPSVRVHGYVADPTSCFASSRVFVAPLRYGAGMKGKIGHSMSHGLPVVTTSIGAEGMMLTDNDTALIADTTETFARAVVRLYTDEALWNTLAQKSVSHIATHWSEEATRRRLRHIFLPSADHSAAAGSRGLDENGRRPA